MGSCRERRQKYDRLRPYGFLIVLGLIYLEC